MRHYLANGENRVVLLTDGAANLGNVDPDALKQKVEANRKQGIALDCFGIGWEDYNDDLLEVLSGNGDGRYAFINTPEEAATEFAAKLAGALQVAAPDVKVQVEFNPQRVTWRIARSATRSISSPRSNSATTSVIAAAICRAEAGNALYTVEINPDGDGPLGTVHVRYRVPGTHGVPRARVGPVPYTGSAPALEQSQPRDAPGGDRRRIFRMAGGQPVRAAKSRPTELLRLFERRAADLWRRPAPGETGMDDPPGQEHFRGRNNLGAR